LAKPCDIYLIDEPSAYLDSEQRVRASKVMKRWIINSKRSAFVVEHDFIMATYLADKVIVFDGIPAKEAYCTSPEGLVSGMNKFLKLMDITFRRDPTNYRPRINKLNSQKDQEQKSAGNYFLMEAQMEEEKKEEEKESSRKPKKDAAKSAADAIAAESKGSKAGEGESHIKGGKGEGAKGEKKSKKDKE
jgi:ATP-binding cassette subfamily E protein 1